MGRSADIRWRGPVRVELRNPSSAIRAEAARACGELEAGAALHDLLDLLFDEDRQVRLAAIFALGRIGGREPRKRSR
jgi:HEAT repeat protein